MAYRQVYLPVRYFHFYFFSIKLQGCFLLFDPHKKSKATEIICGFAGNRYTYNKITPAIPVNLFILLLFSVAAQTSVAVIRPVVTILWITVAALIIIACYITSVLYILIAYV